MLPVSVPQGVPLSPIGFLETTQKDLFHAKEHPLQAALHTRYHSQRTPVLLHLPMRAQVLQKPRAYLQHCSSVD